MTVYWPTSRCLNELRERGLCWPDVARDLVHNVETTTPCAGFATRIRVAASQFQAYCEPGVRDGEPVLVVVGVRTRTRAEPDSDHQPVVGVEPRRSTQRSRGGQGTRWPTTWTELRSLLDALPNVEVRPGGKHLVVYRDGTQVGAFPLHANDHRALLNMCQSLRTIGIDVRRTV